VRARLETLWGARAYDHAGMTEVGAYGFECVAQAGLHVNELEFVAEVLDPDSGRPVAPGEIGELTLTNLGRWGAPVLRYRSGDRVRLATTPCACGRTFARLEGGIFGRGMLDEVRLLLEIDDGMRPAGSVREALTGVAEAVRRDLGIRIEVSAVPARTLPRYELKARRVVRRETPG